MGKKRIDTKFYIVAISKLAEFQELFVIEQIESTFLLDWNVFLVEARPIKEGAKWTNAL